MLVLEHFTTAKLVTTTSPTPNGSRSAPANDVSSRAFIFFLVLYFPSPSDPTCRPACVITPRIAFTTRSPVFFLCCVFKKKKTVGPCLSSIPSIMLQPSVTCIINMDFLTFDWHLSLPWSGILHTDRRVVLWSTLKMSSLFSSGGGGVKVTHTSSARTHYEDISEYTNVPVGWKHRDTALPLRQRWHTDVTWPTFGCHMSGRVILEINNLGEYRIFPLKVTDDYSRQADTDGPQVLK